MTRTYLTRPAGFTLIEMIVALLIVAALMTLAAPSFTTYLHNAQIRVAGEALLNGLQFARAEAVRRNAAVQFDLESNISTGWTVSLVAGEELQSRPAAEGSPNARIIVTPDDTTRLTFNGFGRVLNPNPDASEPIAQMLIQNPDGGSCRTDGGRMRCLQVRVTSGGSVRLCDPTYAAADPRGC